MPGGQRLPALLRREKRRHPLAPHCHPPQRRLPTGSHRPSLGSYFRLRPPRARAWRAHCPLHFSSLRRRPLGSRDPTPPLTSPQPPNLRPRGTPRCSSTPVLRWVPLAPRQPAEVGSAPSAPPAAAPRTRIRPPATRRDWRVSLSVSLSPSNSWSLNCAVSVCPSPPGVSL